MGGTTNAAVTTFVYNNRGQLTHTYDALNQRELFTYDANGNLLTKTDRNGTQFRKAYDHMGRLIRTEAFRGNVRQGYVTRTFAPSGAVLRETNEAGRSTHYLYDARGRLVASVDEDTAVARFYQYNAANNVTAHIYHMLWGISPFLFCFSLFTYDTSQRLQTVVSSSNRVISTYTYDANGRVDTRVNNGISTTYTRNLAGLVTNVTNRSIGWNRNLSSFTYTHYLDGNVQRIVEIMDGVQRTITYTYDNARRLTSEHTTGNYMR